MDIESKPGGILELEFADRSKIIINRHVAAAREIWVAARSGGFHYRAGRRAMDQYALDGEEIYAALARLIGCSRSRHGAQLRLVRGRRARRRLGSRFAGQVFLVDEVIGALVGLDAGPDPGGISMICSGTPRRAFSM